jgi:hypothetical protein
MGGNGFIKSRTLTKPTAHAGRRGHQQRFAVGHVALHVDKAEPPLVIESDRKSVGNNQIGNNLKIESYLAFGFCSGARKVAKP